jgi:hypothetical protein
VTAEDVRQLVDTAYAADALACPVMPTVEVGVFPESGVTRIMEITLNYGQDSQSLMEMREALGISLDMMVAQVTPSDQTEDFSQADKAYALCQYLSQNCTYDPQAGSTAWDALVNHTADSQGLAMALEAGCQAMGVDCQIISGRMDGDDHVWNILTIDGQAYHVDVSNWAAGDEDVFLVADEQLWGGYWWDTSDYPPCPDNFGYFEAPALEASGELDDTQAAI